MLSHDVSQQCQISVAAKCHSSVTCMCHDVFQQCLPAVFSSSVSQQCQISVAVSHSSVSQQVKSGSNHVAVCQIRVTAAVSQQQRQISVTAASNQCLAAASRRSSASYQCATRERKGARHPQPQPQAHLEEGCSPIAKVSYCQPARRERDLRDTLTTLPIQHISDSPLRGSSSRSPARTHAQFNGRTLI